MATPNSWLSTGLFLALITAAQLAAQTASLPGPEHAAAAASNRVHRLYLESVQHAGTNAASPAAARQLALACFDRADYATNDAQRATLAEQGIAASRRAIQLEPRSAAAHHYLGLNLGQLARTKLLRALHLLTEMEAAWTTAAALDAKFHYGGPHRSLGLLYLDAPGWPVSLGSRAKARQQLQRAVQLCPEYPDNALCLLEAQLKWGETRLVRAQLDNVARTIATARATFTGETWARDWLDWDERWRKIKAKAMR